MLELGDYEAAGHERVGDQAAGVLDLLVTKGNRARRIADAARAAGMSADQVIATYTAEDAARAVLERLAPGDVALIKGSLATRMEQVVRLLMDEPHLAPDVLVRQDAAWQQIVTISPDRPTWLEIDLGAIAHNVRRLKELAGEAHLMISLKADAYGHGAIQVAQTALLNGATWLGVACFGEGVALRQAGIRAPILVLGYTPAWQARDVLRHDLTATVFDLDVARVSPARRWRWTAPRASTSRWTPAWDGWASSRTRRWHSFAHCASSLAWSSKASSPISQWLTEPATGSGRIAPNSLPPSTACWQLLPQPTSTSRWFTPKTAPLCCRDTGTRGRGDAEKR